MIEGDIPKDIEGTLLRIGPGKNEVAGKKNDHWFDGDGMIYSFTFSSEQIKFQNCYVKTPAFIKESRKNKRMFPCFGTLLLGPFSFCKKIKNPSNTNIFLDESSIITLYEGGRPYRTDNNFEKFSIETFRGKLAFWNFFGAHPHMHVPQQCYYNIGYFAPSIGLGKPKLNLWQWKKGRKLKKVMSLKMDKPYVVHDFAVSENKIIIFCSPYFIDRKKIWRYVQNKDSLFDCCTWDNEQKTKIYVFDIHSKNVEYLEMERFFVMHVANAFEKNGSTCVDAIVYPDDSGMQLVKDLFHGKQSNASPGKLTRITIGKDHCDSVLLSDVGVELPRINENFLCREHRYVYGIEVSKDNFSSSRLVSIDVHEKTCRFFDFGRACYAGEPIFIPRGTNEVDGYLVSLVYNSHTNASFLAIIDAETLKELARINLPFHIPLGFHGNFFAQYYV
ncbi:carotenoid oxygenase family protein [Candidatus Uabimicrobium amorphum]|uniref:Lignostilbene alpha-beta-dioxygenase n=1 Tax=Uabimicrobium amorphum TaxID=2596890 RepID=A0A5S9IPI0_UABAM|nr:carotenoid oxygenase family protein [Candidatus Uabimicrobium amorphum]BBM85307.1 lignostilbene alpha-beta-dioxygenase [Candidatus Uabimicrobium amorphum]